MPHRYVGATVVLVALTAGGCEVATDDGISIDATGAVTGMAWLDGNGTGRLDGLDWRVQGVRVELRPSWRSNPSD